MGLWYIAILANMKMNHHKAGALPPLSSPKGTKYKGVLDWKAPQLREILEVILK